MKNEVTYRFLNEEDFPVIYKTFKDAFSDYQISISYLTEEKLKNRFIKNGVFYNCSAGAFYGDKMVGFTMVGIDMKKKMLSAFDIATGIIKEFGGMGIAKQMFEFMLPKLRENKIEKFLLEVLIPNENAIKAYQKTGFNINREFKCYEYLLKDAITKDFKTNGIKIVLIDKKNVDEISQDLEWEPSWENSLSSIKRIKDDVLTLGAFRDNLCLGVLVYYPALKWILNLTVKKEFRGNGIGKHLLNGLLDKLEDSTERIFLHNVDETDETMQKFLLEYGFKNVIGQYEMELTLN